MSQESRSVLALRITRGAATTGSTALTRDDDLSQRSEQALPDDAYRSGAATCRLIGLVPLLCQMGVVHLPDADLYRIDDLTIERRRSSFLRSVHE
jgi:hypothetical protein